jgi:hypothetical protein
MNEFFKGFIQKFDSIEGIILSDKDGIEISGAYSSSDFKDLSLMVA